MGIEVVARPFERRHPFVRERRRGHLHIERGVTRLCGTQVVDGAAFAEAMARGERWGGAARKFAIDRAAWPGWQALLAG